MTVCCMVNVKAVTVLCTGYPIIHLHVQGPLQPGELKLQDNNVALSVVTWHGYRLLFRRSLHGYEYHPCGKPRASTLAQFACTVLT